MIEDGQVGAAALAMLATSAVEVALAERAQGGQARVGKFALDHLGKMRDSSAVTPDLKGLAWIYELQAKMLTLKPVGPRSRRPNPRWHLGQLRWNVTEHVPRPENGRHERLNETEIAPKLVNGARPRWLSCELRSARKISLRQANAFTRHDAPPIR